MKKMLFVFLLLAAGAFCVPVFVLGRPVPARRDKVLINDIVMTALENPAGEVDATQLTEQLFRAYAVSDSERAAEGKALLEVTVVFALLNAVLMFMLYLYCEKRVLKPFRKLRRFARNVAAGNLDVPLEQDKYGSFGAFTESFDLMREELKKARENERRASQSKKELVASLSHDIKTPVASVKAVTELMLAKSPENAERLNVIMAKADQIDNLVTNLFNATLEEQEQLTVSPTELHSTVLNEIIKNADYEKKVVKAEIPDCVITADKARLQQVFDNILFNSYKYAGTDISVSARFEGTRLAVIIIDAGPGVAVDELPLICEKYYRGKGAEGKSGFGLGLYIARLLMRKMGGDLECPAGMQNQKGLAVKILLGI